MKMPIEIDSMVKSQRPMATRNGKKTSAKLLLHVGLVMRLVDGGTKVVEVGNRNKVGKHPSESSCSVLEVSV